MGRKPIDEKDLKKRISIRLQQKLIDQIKKDGTLQTVIEQIVTDYYKNRNN